MQWSSPDCDDATSGLRDVDRIHPACFPMMEQNRVKPPKFAHSAIPRPGKPDYYKNAALMQWSSPDCDDATSGLRDVDRIHPACFPMMEQNRVKPPKFAHSAIPRPGKPDYYKNAALMQWSSPDCDDATSGLRDVDRIHPACFPMMEQNRVRPPARAHSAIPMPKAKVPELTKGALMQWSSPDCDDATSGLRDVDRINPACFPMMEQNRVRPPARAHSAIPMPAKAVKAPKAAAPVAAFAQLPSCTDRLTVNCQPMCTESETTGCTETRSAPVNYPMRNWDYRDRYEGRITFERPALDNGTDAGYVRL